MSLKSGEKQMTLSDNDKPLIREIAREVARELGPEIAARAAWSVIDKHIKTCPIRMEVKLAFWKLITALIASGAVGGGIVKLAPFL